MMEKFLIFLIIFALGFHYGNAASMVNGVEEKMEEIKEKLDEMDGNEEQIATPYLWPSFPFFPGLNFPPSMPDWMTQNRPDVRPNVPQLPQLPDLRFPPIRLPWPTPDDDDDDDDDDKDDDEECPDDGVKLISHPDSCKKYILCIEGDEIAELECPNGMHFSRDLRTCMDPDDAGCE